MDPSSIITQVKKDSETPEPPQPTGSSGDESSNNHSLTPAQGDSSRQAKEKEGKNGKRKHKLFHSLLCCFGVRRSKSNGVPAGGEQPHLQETGGAAHPSEEKALLPELLAQDVNKKCLVIDLDETLVHSSFKPISNADFIVPVEIDGTIHQVYVLKRPYVDEFLKKVGELYECVLFTASLAKYADPVTDLLDKWDVFRARLFRESCVFHRGNYVKDLGRLGRELGKVIILDNSPASYIFHPENAVPCTSWFDDMDNKELLEFIPFFEQLSEADNIYSLLRTLQQKMEAGPAPISAPTPSSPISQQQRV